MSVIPQKAGSITGRKLGFVLASTSHGTLIVNRFDYQATEKETFGVGYDLLELSYYHPEEINLVALLLAARREFFGDGVVVLDGGANIGVHTVEWARYMAGWGRVVAVEAQERVFYALAGNIALNNCFNATALHAALTAESGRIDIPQPDYLKPGSFGSLGLRYGPDTEFIGQPVDYTEGKTVSIDALAIDDMPLDRLDFLKLDIEGMEEEVLAGAAQTLARHRPIILAEWLKSAKEPLAAHLQGCGYSVFAFGINYLAVHAEDPCLGRIQGTPLAPVPTAEASRPG